MGPQPRDPTTETLRRQEVRKEGRKEGKKGDHASGLSPNLEAISPRNHPLTCGVTAIRGHPLEPGPNVEPIAPAVVAAVGFLTGASIASDLHRPSCMAGAWVQFHSISRAEVNEGLPPL